MMCFNINNRENFERVAKLMKLALRTKDTDAFPMVQPIYPRARIINLLKAGVSFALQVLVGCKSDLEPEGQVSDDEAQRLAEQYGCQYVLTCAKTNENVNTAFQKAVEAVVVAGRYDNVVVPDSRPSKRGKDARQFLERTNCALQ
jgi:GTPase SAR1 family protein